jgi:hypothetical protein
MGAEVLICVLAFKGGSVKMPGSTGKNFLAANGQTGKRNSAPGVGLPAPRGENITAAIQVRRHHILVILKKDFWITSAACNCMNRRTGDFLR